MGGQSEGRCSKGLEGSSHSAASCVGEPASAHGVAAAVAGAVGGDGDDVNVAVAVSATNANHETAYPACPPNSTNPSHPVDHPHHLNVRSPEAHRHS